MPAEKRFNVQIALHVTAIEDDGEKPFFSNRVQYHNLNYIGLVGVETALLEALERLRGFGVAKARAAGHGEELKLLEIE